MSRTPTLPPTNQKMWRKLVARAHPDTGGDHKLFIWSRAAMEAICSGGVTAKQKATPEPGPPWERSSTEEVDRIPYRSGVFFNEITRRALAEAEEQPSDYARLLRQLRDCRLETGKQRQQQRGASYKQLSFAAHLAGMDTPQRVLWYGLAESIPITDARVSHTISKLKDES